MTARTAPSSESELEANLVTDDEINTWAERERERRRKWLEGPSEEEKREWARLERRRRRAAMEHEEEDEGDISEGRRMADRWERDVALALAGVASRLIDSPYRMLGNLVREGREWEDKQRSSRRRRPRVWLDDEN
jgi:hypothetical protein